MSRIFSQTLREAPSEADVASHQLLLRAGYIRQLVAGVFTYLHLGRRTLDKIETILRQEINAIGGQEIHMPIVHPADLWRETGRWQEIDAEMGRFRDRTDRDMVLAMTHEEVIGDLVRKEIRSYRQLPQLLYHIQPKWRDDPRPRAGLIRAREFTMKDSYSLDADLEGLDKQYRAHYQAYFNIFRRCGLPDVIAVAADVGMMGGSLAHEYMYLTPIGEDTLMLCGSCGSSANRQVARFQKPGAQPIEARNLPACELVATPDCKSIESLANFLGVEKAQTAKAVFLIATLPTGEEQPGKTEERFIFAVVRGDMEVNETKLMNTLHARMLRPATETEIRMVGAEPGYASPVGLLRENATMPYLVIVDDVIPSSPNLVAGANQSGYHLRNVNYGRDYQADIITDIAAAQDGDACPRCGAPLRAVRGVEVGNIFKLGTRYSTALGCTFVDKDRQEKPVIMGSYGIGTGRLLACIAEAHHDEAGLVWPVSVAPFQVHLVLLAGKGDKPEIIALADRIYQELWSMGIEVLYDDRSESPGVKFNDADLLGMPIRLTLGERGFQQNAVEYKRRDQPEKSMVPLTELYTHLQRELSALQAQIIASVVPVPFSD
ncbi:MAG: proline--tRNA ligase [Anaerolineales bacterium]|jgi:prolyl-tRNA synthetase|nr:proline--tRNA ligase [Anaerolineales bacterium]